MRKIFSILLLFTSATANAESTGISIGAGIPYGSKLGVKYSIGKNDTKYYLGAGILSHSSLGGTTLGYGFGFDHKIVNDHHSIGGSFGAVGSTLFLNNSKAYINLGSAINYSYYFSGFNTKSWVVGGSIYSGKVDVPGTEYDKNINGFVLSGGYNF
jgi:hypothetical protein